MVYEELAKIGHFLDLLESFEMAHGMDWLDNFYVVNSKELCKYF